MIDVTDAFRSFIPPKAQRKMIARARRLGVMSFMDSRIVHCDSISELANNYDEIKPCYAYVHGVRYRDPAEAYFEKTDRPLAMHKRNEFIIEDRFGDRRWCWAEDTSTIFSFRKLIPEVYSDHEVLDVVFGPVDFDGEEKKIYIRWYKGRKTKLITSRQLEPVLAFAYCRG